MKRFVLGIILATLVLSCASVMASDPVGEGGSYVPKADGPGEGGSYVPKVSTESAATGGISG